MKLLSLKVEHFRCIRSANVGFADGLNVLYGPNDLGKSSLALAIRAALLLPSSSTEYKAFAPWHEAGDPHVELVFESEPERIWRVKKTFGTATAHFEWSRDGVDFAADARGRQVDERIGEILKWGVAPPGGKGRPKGMPMTFLTAALLPEQDKVSAIFSQALAEDSDESGRKQLMSALNAMNEDPTFKAVLARVQARVDEAFTAQGGKKRGANSPWMIVRELIQRKTEQHEQAVQELVKTTAIEAEIQDLLDRRGDVKELADKAESLLEGLRRDLEKQNVRREIGMRVQERQARVDEIAREVQALSAAERAHEDGTRNIAKLTKARDDAASVRDAAAAQTRKEQEKLDRLQSKDRARERQLEQSKLETRRNALGSDQLRNEAALVAIRAAEAAHAKVGAVEKELSILESSVVELRGKGDAAAKQRAQLDAEERDLRAIRTWFQWQTARDLVQQAEKGLSQVMEWRASATAKRAEADALSAALPRFPLPQREQLNDLRKLAEDLRVAEAKANVGLVVTLRPLKPLRAKVQRDGDRPTLYEVSGPAFETGAERKLQLEIEGIADITFTGGAADARETVEGLEKRWAAEARPVLQQAGVGTIDELQRIVTEAGQHAAAIDSARRDAAQLEQRIADQPDWAALLAERQRQLSENACDDPAKMEKAAKRLKLADAVAVEKRLEALRGSLDALAKEDKLRDAEMAAGNARVTEKQKSLGEARAAMATAQGGIEGDWRVALRRVTEQQAEVARELEKVDARLKELSSADDRNLAAAKRAVAAAGELLAEAESDCKSAEQKLTQATLAHATNEGLLKARRDAVARLDQAGARAALEQVEAEFRAAPAPSQPVTGEMLAEAQRVLDQACAQLDDADAQIHTKRGALQQVGGEVARQRADDAAMELQFAKAREQQVQLEYEAWELLRKTLREAEQDEGTHLGRALADPIANRFAALTTGRYGKLALGPNLETGGIAVGGENRAIDLLSLGTRDQLSTIFRLTLAEQLNTAVILDDQLAQSDSGRMGWLRDLLKEIAAKIQVIVFTCRPEDYAVGTKKQMAAHAVDLVKFIDRA